MDKYALAFSISNLGPKSYLKLLNKFGSAHEAWKADELEYSELGIKGLTYKKFDNFRQSFDHVRYAGHMKKAAVKFISYTDILYPKSLKLLANPPIGLFCKGNINLIRDSGESLATSDLEKSDPGQARMTLFIAVVGARKITQYGRDVTETIVSSLSQSGICIVSGLALGVDAVSHRTALQNNSSTIAVLGCGVDCCFPSENYGLYTDILKKNGLIISEYPLGVPPNKGTFPARNRIIAALSDGVLVTEAAEGSGSLITADYATQLGKKLFAVPGSINSPMAKGSLRLLKQGASLVTEANDMLQEFSVSNSQFSNKSKIKKLNLSKEEKKIVSLLENEGMTIDEIAKKLKLNVSTLFVSISNLELKGIIKNSGGKLFLLN